MEKISPNVCIRCLCDFLHLFGLFQLHAKYEKLKKDSTDEKRKLEEARKRLEDDIIEFNHRKQQMAQQLTSSHHTLTLGKSKKK